MLIFCSRWVRLLFGREFAMQDLLVLWDAIFADGIGFELVDFVFVAMLLYLREARAWACVVDGYVVFFCYASFLFFFQYCRAITQPVCISS